MRDARNYHRIASFFFLLIGVFFVLYARRVEIGTWTEPGPGFLPFWAGFTLSVMSIGLFLESYAKRVWEERPPFFRQPDSWKRVLSTFSVLVAYNLLLTTLGFTLMTFLFIGFLVRFVFPQTWRRTIIVAVLGSVCARLLFVNFLETQLPKGFLGF